MVPSWPRCRARWLSWLLVSKWLKPHESDNRSSRCLRARCDKKPLTLYTASPRAVQCSRHERTATARHFISADPDILEREHRRSFRRAITAMALADRSRKPDEILRSAWPHDDMAERLLKAASSPTSTSSYPTHTTAATLPALAPQSAAVRLFST